MNMDKVIQLNRIVALRKESVDRNTPPLMLPIVTGVALRKESVDRNWIERNVRSMAVGSLSARRAWIEIHIPRSAGPWPAGRSPQGERG